MKAGPLIDVVICRKQKHCIRAYSKAFFNKILSSAVHGVTLCALLAYRWIPKLSSSGYLRRHMIYGIMNCVKMTQAELLRLGLFFF